MTFSSSHRSDTTAEPQVDRGTFRRRFARSIGMLLLVPFATVAFAGLAVRGRGASLLPATTTTYTYGDCTLAVGTHPDPNFYAVAGATISCTKRHSYTIGTVRLWRWNGAQWVDLANGSATFTNSFGFGTRELYSTKICGGGNAYWTETLDVNIAGVGSATVGTSVKTFSPHAC